MLPRSRATRATVSGDVVAGLDDQVGAEHGGELAQRLQLALLLGVWVAPGRRDPQQVELRAEALGRAPRAAHEPLRARVGLDQREQALADGLRPVGGQCPRACRRPR